MSGCETQLVGVTVTGGGQRAVPPELELDVELPLDEDEEPDDELLDDEPLDEVLPDEELELPDEEDDPEELPLDEAEEPDELPLELDGPPDEVLPDEELLEDEDPDEPLDVATCDAGTMIGDAGLQGLPLVNALPGTTAFGQMTAPYPAGIGHR